MSHAIIKRPLYLAVKYVLLALLAAAIVILLGIGNLFVRTIVVSAILGGIYLKVHRRIKSRSYNEVGYWSGLDDFDIGIFDCFDDEDIADIFEDTDHETKSAY